MSDKLTVQVAMDRKEQEAGGDCMSFGHIQYGHLPPARRGWSFGRYDEQRVGGS